MQICWTERVKHINIYVCCCGTLGGPFFVRAAVGPHPFTPLIRESKKRGVKGEVKGQKWWESEQGLKGKQGGKMREKGWEERGPKAHSFGTPVISYSLVAFQDWSQIIQRCQWHVCRDSRQDGREARAAIAVVRESRISEHRTHLKLHPPPRADPSAGCLSRGASNVWIWVVLCPKVQPFPSLYPKS